MSCSPSTLQLLRSEQADAEQSLWPQNLHSTFPLFARLPAELRLLTWRFALPRESRVLRLQRRGASRRGARGPYGLTSPPAPALLHANREARHEATRHYSVIATGGGGGPPSRIYWAPATDVLRITFSIDAPLGVGQLLSSAAAAAGSSAAAAAAAARGFCASVARLEYGFALSDADFADERPLEAEIYSAVFADFAALHSLTLLAPRTQEPDDLETWASEFADYCRARRARTGATFREPVIGCRWR